MPVVARRPRLPLHLHLAVSVVAGGWMWYGGVAAAQAAMVAVVDPTRVAVPPPSVDAHAQPWRERWHEALVEGLQRGAEPLGPEVDAFAAPASCEDPPCDDRALELTCRVEGDDANYTLVLELRRPGDTTVVARRSARCEICGHAEVTQTLADEAALLAPHVLDPEATEVPPAPILPRHPDPIRPPVAAPPPPPRLRGMQIAGWSLLGAGLGLATAGAVLVGIDSRPYRARCDGDDRNARGDCRFLYDTRAGGITALTSGAAALGVGAVLLVVRHVRRKRAHGR